jgi:hypothetical protein
MLRSLAPDLHVIDLPLVMPGGVRIGTRTSLVRLRDGRLWVHSPGPVGDAGFEAIAKLGEVAHVVAPNLLHNLFVKEWLARHPGTTLHAPVGFEQKLANTPFEPLTDTAPAAWAGAIDQVPVAGAPRMNETAFVHRASRTLLLTDLCFNLQRSDSFATRLFLRVAGALGRFGPSRFARFLMKDKPAVRKSVDRILALDFDRVIVTHGEVLERGGHEAFRQAFAWLGNAPGSR